MFAEVIVNSSVNNLNKTFDYKIPEELQVSIGMRVIVPFARRKNGEMGYVVGIKDASEYECKSIIKVCDRVFDDKKLELAKFMARKYFCNLSDVLKLLVPPGTGKDFSKVKAKTEKWAYINDDVNVDFFKSDKQKRIIEFLLNNGESPVSQLLDFTDTTISVLKTLEKNGFVTLKDNEVMRNPFSHKVILESKDLKLTDEQRMALKSVDLDKFNEYLLFGVTGSGKTEIYMQLIEKIINNGKNAILLVPEISLTPQITDRFLSRFGENIAILHSRLSIGERFDEWKKISSGKSKIVIGARSAIFAPIYNIGIVIVDEEHDNSYKSETTPKYDAREVAKKICEMNNCPLILGSATPDICTYYKAMEGNIKLLELNERISKNGMPDIEIVDLRDELASGNRSVFSRKLFDEINTNLKNKEQTILFLNRRGYSTFVMCRDCGYVVKCEKCDVSMTYHLKKNKLFCHYCGAEKENVTICPECGSKNIRYFGTGTEKIEQEINKYFPAASIIRMDVDTTTTKNAHENILNKFRDEKIDILLGTQMIAKGHDFENVTLVGVLAADTSINIGDYRANERTYELLTQVSGRAGRGEKKGRAIIQTYMPDEFSILAVKEQNYRNFYNKEIIVREKLNYPPFCDIIIGVLIGADEKEVICEANKLYDIFKVSFKVYNPIPAPISKINEDYRWRLLMKTRIDDESIQKINDCLEKYNLEKNENVRLSLSVNPSSML